MITLLNGDANLDALVNGTDYYIWSSHFGQYGGVQIGDFAGDGHVGSEDISLWYPNYGRNLQTVSLLADLNGDWVVDFADLDILYANDTLANPTRANGDLDGDGDIDLADLDLAYAQFGLHLDIVS